MKNQNILKSVIDLTKGQASMAFVTFILAFAFIVRDVSKILGFKESPIVILLAIFFIIAVLIWRIAKFEKRRLPDLSDSQLFYPFLENISPEVRSNYLLETIEVGKDVLEIIDQEKTRHFALVGNSGAGKTILLKNYVFPVGANMLKIQEYNQNTLTTGVNQFANFVNAKNDRTINNARNIIRDIDVSSSNENDAVLTNAITTLIAAYTQEKTLYVLFDQAERLVSTIENAHSLPANLDIKKFKLLLQALRKHPQIRTIFSVRSDAAIQTIETIAIKLENLDRDEDISTSIRYYLYPGFDANSSDLTGILDEKFNKLNIKVDGNRVDGRAITNALKNRGSNTLNAFKVQLSGYMAEAFISEDSILQNQFAGNAVDMSSILRRYWYYLKEEYNHIHGSAEHEKRLFIVLFTIAAFNKRFGAPLSATDVSNYSSLSSVEVKNAINYLHEKRIISNASDVAEAGEFRLVHDIVRDYFLNDSYRKVRRAYLDAIEAQFDTFKFDSEDSFTPQRNWFSHNILELKSYVRPSFLIILLMMGVCMIRLCAPEILMPVFENIKTRIGPFKEIIMLQEPSKIQYLPRMIVQFLWVTFMYNFDLNYFSQTLPKTATLTRIISRIAAPLGAISGALTVFSPSLFIVPITIGGTLLAVVYYNCARKNYMRNLANEIAVELGGKTAVNMAITIGFTAILYVFFHVAGNIELAEMTAFFFAVGFLYFYFMMRPRQCSSDGWGEMFVAGRVKQ